MGWRLDLKKYTFLLYFILKQVDEQICLIEFKQVSLEAAD